MNIINESVDEIVNENSIYDKNINTWDELNLNTDILCRSIYEDIKYLYILFYIIKHSIHR